MAPAPPPPPPPPPSSMPQAKPGFFLPFSLSPLLLFRCRFHLPVAAASRSLLQLRIRPGRIASSGNRRATSRGSSTSARNGGSHWRHSSGPLFKSLATRAGLGYSVSATGVVVAASAAAFGSVFWGNCVGSVGSADVRENQWLDKLKSLTGGLIIANVLLFVGQVVTKGLLTDIGANTAAIAQGQWWRLITAAFLHGGPLHLLVNMYSLYNTGPLIQMLLGTPALISIYGTSAVTGNLMSYAFTTRHGQATSVGASGAIFGLIGAVLAANNHIMHVEGIWPPPGLKESLLQTLVLNVIIGLQPGFLGGYLTAWYLISNLSVCASKCRLGPLVWKQKCEQVQQKYIEYQREVKALPSKNARSDDSHAREVLDRKREKLIVEAETALAAAPTIFSRALLKQDLRRIKKKLENNPLL